PASKLHPLGDGAAWGGSGARSVLYDLEVQFAAEATEIVGSQDVGRALQERIVPVLRHHYANFITVVPGEEPGGTPSAYVLAAGYSHGDPFIVKVDPSGLIARYEEVGFHAIGSGAPMAQQAAALLGHFRMMERDVDHGVVAVVRVLDALATSQPMVGGPLSVVRITPDGARHLGQHEISIARDHVARWEEREQAVLDGLFDEDS
ncbi:MAG: hypothetical protein WD377_00480, partial [Nitriliruptoraceae bacterium]